MAFWIKANGEVQAVQPANGEEFTLEEIHTFVGGFFEVVFPGRLLVGKYITESLDRKTMTFIEVGPRTCLLIDEIGKLKMKPVNRIATALYLYNQDDVLVGDVLMCEFGTEIT